MLQLELEHKSNTDSVICISCIVMIENINGMSTANQINSSLIASGNMYAI